MMVMKGSASRFKIVFLFATLALITLSILSFIRIKNLISASEWVTHTHDVKSGIERTLQELLKAETSQRGYIISKDSVFLTNFNNAIYNVKGFIDAVDSLTKDNEEQQQNLITLREVVNKRMIFMEEIANEAAISTITPQQLLGGKFLMDAVHTQMNKMIVQEDILLKKRTAELDKEIFITPLITFFLIIGAIIILIMSYLRISDELKLSGILKAQVEERESRIQHLFKAAPDAVVTIDHNGIITNWNAEAETMFGWNKDETIGKSLTETIIPERYRQQQNNGMKHYLKTGEDSVMNKPVEIYALQKNGNEIPVELKISASQFNNQEPVFIAFIRDITKRKQIDESLKNQTNQLLVQNQELVKLNKELEAFAYISSHDLQEPLRKIQTFTNRICEDEKENLSVKGKSYFDRIQIAALRMEILIKDLLTYSRTNTAERKFEKANLRDIVDEIKNDFKDELLEKRGIIEAAELSDCVINPLQFRQLLHNLIGNALKFSKSNQPPHIVIKCVLSKNNLPTDLNLEPEKEYYHITVSDNGIGFDSQYKNRIFEMFQRLHAESGYEGTGMGLAIVKKIVDNHNGIITATSEINKGAQFDIFIPA